MKKNILERYPRSEDGKIIIEISAGRIEDLYSNFDKLSPFSKKELNSDLADYLIDCIREIGKHDFIIRFHFTTVSDLELHERVKNSITNYFLYLKELEVRELTGMIRASIIYLLIGFSIFSISVWLTRNMSDQKSVFYHVLSEGLTVATWVSLWQGLANFIVNWAPHRKKISIYERIAGAVVDVKI